MTPIPGKSARGIGRPAAQPTLLHVSPSFSRGGVPLRTCRIINHFGKEFRHIIIALDGNLEALGDISPDIDVVSLAPAQRHSPLRDIVSAVLALRRIKPDLLITYNWGSMD